MKIAKRIFLGFSLIFIIFMGLANFYLPLANAQGLWDKQIGRDQLAETFNANRTPTDVRQVTVNVIKVFLTFMSIITMIYIILGGYKWMTAGGNDDRVQEGKKYVRNAVIGLIIILLAYTITNYVGRCVLNVIHNEYWLCNVW